MLDVFENILIDTKEAYDRLMQYKPQGNYVLEERFIYNNDGEIVLFKDCPNDIKAYIVMRNNPDLAFCWAKRTARWVPVRN